MRKILFIDRDGTLINEPEDEQIDSYEKLDFLPNVISALKRIKRFTDYEFVIITNQDGLGTKSFPEETFWPAHNLMLKIFKSEGVEFSEILIDKTFPADNAPTRKPGIALLNKYIQGDYDLGHSFVIGDRTSDLELAKNLKTKSIFISDSKNSAADFSSKDWLLIAEYIVSNHRSAEIVRETKETKIFGKLSLVSNQESRISTGIGFFDHMLEQLAFHSGGSLQLEVAGDLQIDEHHTIEDVGLALGAAYKMALGDKLGVSRYGFSLPMDEAAAHAMIDFSGRPELVWDVEFKREMIGEMPTEMFKHFFKSFADSASCNINISCQAENEHHKIEAIFKAVAKSIKQAVQIDYDSTAIPSTKKTL